MHKIAYSGIFNAQIASTVICQWISSWKLYFSSAAAAWLRSRQAWRGALAGRRIAGASFATLTLQEAWEARWRGRHLSGGGLLVQKRLLPAAQAQYC